MQRILYIYPTPSTFIKKDLDLLRKHYDVRTPRHTWEKKIFLPALFLRQLVFLLVYAPGSKAIIVRFGGYWSLLPSLVGKLFCKPVYIILGGTDCTAIPELHYGSLRRWPLRSFIYWSYRLCTRLLPVHSSLVQSEYSYINMANKNQGYRSFFPDLDTPYTEIHNGFDPNRWTFQPEKKTPLTFATVAAISNGKTYVLKGIDLMVDLAQIYQSCEFHIAGVDEITLRKFASAIPANVICHGFLTQYEVCELISSCTYYLQLSMSEGFPNALCEAMLCGCIPIGSDVGAISLIIGETGKVIARKDIGIIRKAIDNLIQFDHHTHSLMAARARQRITDLFGMDRRESALRNVIQSKD